MENLKVSYKMQGDYLMVYLEGSLTLMDALELKKVLPPKVENHSLVKIDLNRVSSMDLTGFNALLMTKKKMKDNILEMIVDKNHVFHELTYLTKLADQFLINSKPGS